MSFYVKRERDNRVGWVGPIRSERQAYRERDAWRDADWSAHVFSSTPEVRRWVRTWERDVARFSVTEFAAQAQT